jgi:amino-acid N-acetyltransferase
MAAPRCATLDDRAAARELLTAAHLPADDLDLSQVRLTGAWLDDVLVGVIGLEFHGRDGLLRSLVVRPESRRLGIGNALLGALGQQARGAGITRLWLLTETAEAFLSGNGDLHDARAGEPRLA